MKLFLTTIIILYCYTFSIAGGGGGGGGGSSYVGTPAGMPACSPSATAPGETACAATPICDFDGYCGSTSGYSANAWTELFNAFSSCVGGGLSVDNDAYLSFVASSTTVNFDIYIYNCNSNQCVQLFMFSAANCSSGNVTGYQCSYQLYANANSYPVSASGLTVGETYYILIDGCSGDVCSYSFVAQSGINTSVELSTGLSPSICTGGSIDITATGGVGGYTWSGDPGLSSTSGGTVTITPPPTPGVYNYSVTSNSGTACNPVVSSVNFVVTSVAPFVITGNTTLCALGTTSDLAVAGEIDYVAPTVTGSPTITDIGNDKIYVFNANGTFKTTVNLTNVKVLLVGGGGGGGGIGSGSVYGGAGGGAGGLRSLTMNIASSATAYPVVVGTGGAVGVNGAKGGSGSASSFNGFSAAGGGGGGSQGDPNGASGGSGGGGRAGSSAGSGNTPATTPSQGNNGLSGNSSGGGGGAGTTGTAGNSSTGGNGGAGISNTISGSAVTYAGGGAGGGTNGSGGSGGSGGGGNSPASRGAGSPGTDGTGGGGGGATGSSSGSAFSGGKGGKGVVMIRYTVPKWTSSNPAVATVNPSTGLVTAVSFGSTTITYTNIYGCSAFVLFHVGSPLSISSSVSNETCVPSNDGSINSINISGGLSSVRYIRIKQNLTAAEDGWLNLLKMEANEILTGTNVASGKSGTLSQPVSGYGTPVTSLTNGTGYHSSAPGETEWVEVDLGAEFDLDKIKIWNRNDGDLNCCGSRSRNLQLILKNGAGTVIDNRQIDVFQNMVGAIQEYNVLDAAWSDGASTLNRTGLDAGIYTLTCSDNSSCNTVVHTNEIVTNPVSPSIINTATGVTTGLGDVFWTGESSSVWGLTSNWYYHNGTNFIPSPGLPANTNNAFILPSSVLNACIHPTNIATVTAVANAKNVFIGTDGILKVNAAQTLNVYGNWTNNGTLNQDNTGVVNMTGTSNQTIGGASTIKFTNLTVNKASNSVTLNKATTVSRTLKMTAGNINTTATNLLTVGESAAIAGLIDWTAGTVLGPLKRYYTNAAQTGSLAEGIFPVGNASYNRYARVNFTANPGGGTITTKYVAGLPSVGNTGLPTTVNGIVVNNYENEGYWEIAPAGGSLNATAYNLTLRGNHLSTVNDASKLRIIKSSGAHTTWDNAGIGSHTAPVAVAPSAVEVDFTITNTGLSGYSFFNIGSDNNNPLPVELTSFSSTCVNGEVQINWTTASEQNSQDFVVERSRDMNVWQEVEIVPAAGNSSQNSDYFSTDGEAFQGPTYYRLRQRDLNGEEEIFGPIAATCGSSTNSIQVFPNPTQGSFTVEITSLSKENDVLIQLIDTRGKIVDLKQIDLEIGNNFAYFNKQIESGIYLIRVLDEKASFKILKLEVRN